MDLLGLYAGIVENVRDPEKLGRVKVRVPHVYGVTGSTVGAIPTNDLPWAMPMGLPAGGSAASGGGSWLPEMGDQVLVQFLDGEPEKPVWSWFMQTQGQAKKFGLHRYATTDGTVGNPERSAWTRYGHTVEWNSAGLILTTSGGYRLTLTDPGNNDGQVRLATSAGQYLSLDDDVSAATLNVLDDFYLNVGDQIVATCSKLSLTTTSDDLSAQIGADLVLDIARSAFVTAAAKIELDAPRVNLGNGAVEPVPLGTQLTLFLNSLLLWLSTHTHASATPGTPTSPPLIPPNASVTEISQILSQTAFVK